MPIDPKKREKEVMKKRRKAKEAARQRHQQGLVSLSPRALVQRARDFPILGCWISKGWQTGAEGLIQVTIARRQPNGRVAFGVYLMDVYCLGVKDTWCNADFSVGQYQEVLGKLSQAMSMESCSAELAHQLIYQGIDYAAQFGFKPHSDFKLSQLILSKRGELPESHDLKFGKDGKPLFIAGPYDNVKAIIARLERYAGAGNYHYLVMADDSSDA